MPSQTLMIPFPLRIADLPKKALPGLSAADQEFAEVFSNFLKDTIAIKKNRKKEGMLLDL